jgi:hypothetical protein
MAWQAAAAILGGISTMLDTTLSTVGLGYNIYQDQRDFLANQSNIDRAYEANERNLSIQREREDTAVQRRALDLERAGLNPLLAVGQPASSSAPIQAGTGSHHSSRIQAPRLDVAATLLQLRKGVEEIRLLKEESNYYREQAGKSKSESLLTDAERTLVEDRRSQIAANILELESRRGVQASERDYLSSEAIRSQTQAEVNQALADKYEQDIQYSVQLIAESQMKINLMAEQKLLTTAQEDKARQEIRDLRAQTFLKYSQANHVDAQTASVEIDNDIKKVESIYVHRWGTRPGTGFLPSVTQFAQNLGSGLESMGGAILDMLNRLGAGGRKR